MKIVSSNRSNGQFSVAAVPEFEYETAANPSNLRLDFTALKPESEYVVGAATIVFPHIMEFAIVKDPLISVSGSKALEKYLGSEFTHFGVCSQRKTQRPGQSRLIIGDFRSEAVPRQFGNQMRNLLVQVRDTTIWRGGLFSTDRIELSANMSSFTSVGLTRTEFYTAVALCLAGDFSSQNLIVEKTEGVTDEKVQALEDLARGLGISLRILAMGDFEARFEE
ncbi:MULTISPECIES: hypothetical protein [Corynebacterium]|uniref:hypothetical protein n=1 Tax=Corynebacterium TaxID=1716 RepID=UPI0008A11204|nr:MULTISPECIES: hypothetical protein [Corynebacterium]MCT1564262.1 hypothetical protein [Corynebacterium glucuronolyticum]OFO45723.1 hypothetical protein HMPREF3044_11585 [Corynebacterium sp. HMSC073D01]